MFSDEVTGYKVWPCYDAPSVKLWWRYLYYNRSNYRFVILPPSPTCLPLPYKF